MVDGRVVLSLEFGPSLRAAWQARAFVYDGSELLHLVVVEGRDRVQVELPRGLAEVKVQACGASREDFFSRTVVLSDVTTVFCGGLDEGG